MAAKAALSPSPYARQVRQAAAKAILLVLIAGCATGESVTLANDKGERWYCTKSDGGEQTAAERTRDFERCLNAAGMQGFTRLPK